MDDEGTTYQERRQAILAGYHTKLRALGDEFEKMRRAGFPDRPLRRAYRENKKKLDSGCDAALHGLSRRYSPSAKRRGVRGLRGLPTSFRDAYFPSGERMRNRFSIKVDRS